MASFKAAYINEVERLLKRKKATVIVVISIITIIIGQLIISGFRAGLGIRAANSAEFPLVVLPFLASFILPLFTALVAIDAFADEYSSNTMKIALLKPVTRIKLYTAKICAIATFALWNLMLVMILSSLSGLLFNESYITLKSVYTVFIAYISTIVPIMVVAMFVVLLCHWLKNGTAIFFLSVGLYILSYAGSVFLPQLSTLFITYNLSWYNLFVTGVPFFKILRIFLLLLGYGIMFFTAGYYLFDRKSH